jgi:hypothetical protein
LVFGAGGITFSGVVEQAGECEDVPGIEHRGPLLLGAGRQQGTIERNRLDRAPLCRSRTRAAITKHEVVRVERERLPGSLKDEEHLASRFARREGTRSLVEIPLGQRHLALEGVHPPHLERRRRPVHLPRMTEPLLRFDQPAFARITRAGQQIAQHLPANREQRWYFLRGPFTSGKVDRDSGAVAPFQREDRSGNVRGDDTVGGALVLRLLLRRVHRFERLAVTANSRQ